MHKYSMQYGYGETDPFGGSSQPMGRAINPFGSISELHYKTNNPWAGNGMPPSGLPGSPAAGMAQGQPGLYGGADQDNTVGSALDLAGNLTPDGSFMLPFNGLYETGKYMRGGGPSWQELQKVREGFSVDPNKDSYLGAGKKLLNGVGWGLNYPVSMGRMIANDAHQAFSKDPIYKGITGTLSRGANVASLAGRLAGQGISHGYDQIANRPMNQAFKPTQPKPMQNPIKPIAKPPTKPLQNNTPAVTNPYRV